MPYIWLCLVVRHHIMLFDVPFEAQLYGSQAEAYLCLGDLQSAAGCYQQARRLQPSGGSCHHTRLALIYHLQVVHTHTHTHTHLKTHHETTHTVKQVIKHTVYCSDL